MNKIRAYKNETKEIFVQVYGKNLCNISRACKASNISRGTYYNWLENDLEFKDRILYENEKILDLAESKLIEEVEKGKSWAIKFLLITKGRSRGYGTIDNSRNDFNMNNIKIEFGDVVN